MEQFALDGWQTLPDVASAVERLEFAQEDSINVCGRIHDLILWARVAGYAPSLLHDALYQSPRQVFEYYFPNLVVLPLADYPYFVRAMQRRAATPGRWHGLQDDEHAVAERVLAHMDTHGPLRTRAAAGEDGHTMSGWGTRTTVAARVITKLWLHGRLTVARRENFERWFDRTERLLPHVAALPLPTEADEQAHLLRKRKRSQRLFRLRKGDTDTLGADAFVPLKIEGVARQWWILREDLPALHAAHDGTASDTLHLLAPLDPLVYDRGRNRDVWDFDYTWEVYTPAAKRKWGYYVLPILHGDRLVGRVDPKIDRKTGLLTLHSLTLENPGDAGDLLPPLAARLADYARFLGASRVEITSADPAAFRLPLTKETNSLLGL